MWVYGVGLAFLWHVQHSTAQHTVVEVAWVGVVHQWWVLSVADVCMACLAAVQDGVIGVADVQIQPA